MRTRLNFKAFNFGNPRKTRLQGVSRSFKPFGNALELLIRNSLKNPVSVN